MLAGKRGLILVNPTIRKPVSEAVVSFGGFVYSYKKPDELMESIVKDRPDFVLLDDRFALESNCQLIFRLREHAIFGKVPILVLSSSLSLSLRQTLIFAGVDLILKKKLDLEVLALKIFSLLRRSQSYQKGDEMVDFGEISVNPQRHYVVIGGREIKLTKIEFKVCLELLSKKGEVVSREMLAQSFLSLRNSNDRTLDVHINALRRKLGPIGQNLTTVRGRGYMFRF